MALVPWISPTLWSGATAEPSRSLRGTVPRLSLAADSRPEFEIWEPGNPGIWKSKNLNIWEPRNLKSSAQQKNRNSQNANMCCQRLFARSGLVGNKSSRPHFVQFQANVSMYRNKNVAKLLPIFLCGLSVSPGLLDFQWWVCMWVVKDLNS